jgi:glycosyltransferase involved in cell wall biosynthesis
VSQSLSVLLPVHNAERRLARDVQTILDVLPELTPNFNVLVIDNGSTDETSEVAAGLARRYPQVNFVRHPRRMAVDGAIESGLDNSDGDIVLVADEQQGLDMHDMQRLWEMRDDENLVLAQTRVDKPQVKQSWLSVLTNWRPGQPKPTILKHTGVRILRRDTVEQVRLSMVEPPVSTRRNVSK